VIPGLFRRAAAACGLVALLAAPAMADPVVRDLVFSLNPAEYMRTSRPRPAAARLDAEALQRLQRAQVLRRQGALGPARTILEDLLRANPHHPSIVIELVETHFRAQEWAALERMCRSERTWLRDSIFLAQPLVQSLVNQARYRDAAQAAVEAVVASPTAAPWVSVELRNLALANPAGVSLTRDGLRAAWVKNPHRVDLLRLVAQLEYLAGHTERALDLLETPLRMRSPGSGLLAEFAQQLLRTGLPRDSAAAARALETVARHPEAPVPERVDAAQRAFAVRAAQGQSAEAAVEISRALRDVPPTRWGERFALDMARALREGGRPAESRELLERLTADPARTPPHLLLERGLSEMRDGDPSAAARRFDALAGEQETGLEARYQLGEALFFSGQADSALVVLERLAREAPGHPRADAALERVYLIEDARPREALQAYARASYALWRGEPRPAEATADSLFRSLPRGTLWARSALLLSEAREQQGRYREAIPPLAALADSLPGDRLAPLARKRMGDIYRIRLDDTEQALREYEECLARYPKAWLAPEVRRLVESLRRSRTF
jgi:tetratricopeptide (TPR) repeat protein